MHRTILQYLGRCRDDEELAAFWEKADPRDPHEALWVITYDRARATFTVVSFPTVVSHWSHQLYGSSYDREGMERELTGGLWSAPEAAKESLQSFLHGL